MVQEGVIVPYFAFVLNTRNGHKKKTVEGVQQLRGRRLIKVISSVQPLSPIEDFFSLLFKRPTYNCNIYLLFVR